MSGSGDTCVDSPPAGLPYGSVFRNNGCWTISPTPRHWPVASPAPPSLSAPCAALRGDPPQSSTDASASTPRFRLAPHWPYRLRCAISRCGFRWCPSLILDDTSGGWPKRDPKVRPRLSGGLAVAHTHRAAGKPLARRSGLEFSPPDMRRSGARRPRPRPTRDGPAMHDDASGVQLPTPSRSADVPARHPIVGTIALPSFSTSALGGMSLPPAISGPLSRGEPRRDTSFVQRPFPVETKSHGQQSCSQHHELGDARRPR